METDTDRDAHGEREALLQGVLCGCADAELPAPNELVIREFAGLNSLGLETKSCEPWDGGRYVHLHAVLQTEFGQRRAGRCSVQLHTLTQRAGVPLSRGSWFPEREPGDEGKGLGLFCRTTTTECAQIPIMYTNCLRKKIELRKKS